jgi:FAD/FMN-containing dehydrogenase/Fe-S oxidoreductase
MDQERQRIQEDLRGLLEGEVRCDDVFRQLYANDASIYEIKPLGVVRPRGTADVVALVQYASQHQIPLHARGAGTGLAGESLGPGLVVDFSHAMRRIVRTDADTVRVQPGVVLGQLNRHLAQFGRLFGPDPATAKVTTMGSVLAIDAAGSHWMQYGSARRHVESIQVVLANGELIEAARRDLPARAGQPDSAPLDLLVSRLAGLLEREADTIAKHQPKGLVNRSGYALHEVLVDGKLDLAKLLVGSEGTLALMTEATVRTSPRPQGVGVVLLFFSRLQNAAAAALEVRRIGASACDLMDRRLLSLARESDIRYNVVLPPEAEALLLVEQQGDDSAQVRDRLLAVSQQICRRKRLAFDSRIAMDRDDVEFFWRLPQYVVPTLYRLKGSERPLPFVEDIAVPPETLPDFLTRSQNVLKKHQVTASLFAHAGHGQLHIRPFLDLAKVDHVRRMQNLARDLYREVLDVGGTISGEHADGLSRSWFIREQFGPLYNVFHEVKRIFDPQNIFNPGKIVGDLAQPIGQNLRPLTPGQARTSGITPLEESEGPVATAPPASVDLIRLQLNWNHADIVHTASSCNGCGSCRSQSPAERMCPIFRFAPAEEASPRAKANLMRGVLSGQLEPAELSREEMKRVADLCVNCHQCRLECPANVDIPKLMVECKAQYVATNGLTLSEWLVARLDLLSAWGSTVRPLANWALASRRMRWLLEKTTGIAQGRKLPRLAPRSFLRWAQRRRLTRPARHGRFKALYFVDVYANWYDVELAEAVVAVLEHNGVAVFVPAAQRQSAMAMITAGALDQAKRLAAHNLAILADAVRHGYHIVASEPAAALCLTHEYPNLIDDDDARLVAANTSEVCAYLWSIHQQGKLELDLKPVNATLGYHQPCHMRALGAGSPGENLLRLVPGLSVRRIEQGCSGMAGTFGLRRENYRSSLRAGWGLIYALREPTLHAGTTECSACKLQMEQGTTKPTIHPLKILAASYGLMPELASLLAQRGEDLIVT